MSESTRRTVQVAYNWSVTVITTQGEAGPIDTVRGAPPCRQCGKALRPNYDMDYLWRDTFHYFTEEPDTEQYHEWDKAREQWFIKSTHRVITRRKFLGTFGAYRDNLFCGLRCGYNAGVDHFVELQKRARK